MAKTKTVYITEPCKINGEDHEPGDSVEMDENDAVSVVAAGRGTIKPPAPVAKKSATKQGE